MPQSIIEWCWEARGRIFGPEKHSLALIESISLLADLFSEIKKGMFATQEEAMIAKLLELDAELETWVTELPEECMFTVEEWSGIQDKNYFEGKSHVYDNIW